MKYRVAPGFFLIGILIFLAACGTTGSLSGSQGAQTPTSPPRMQTVNVAMFNDHISSSMMSFVVGTPYHFVVTNNGHQPYAFAMMSKDREQEMEQMPMAQRHQTAMYMDNTIAPGQMTSFNYTFGSSMMKQNMEFASYQQGGNQVHMRLPFTMHS